MQLLCGNALASDGFHVSSAGNDWAKLLCQVLAKLAELERIPSTTSELHHQASEFGARVDLRDHLQSITRENSLDLQPKNMCAKIMRDTGFSGQTCDATWRRGILQHQHMLIKSFTPPTYWDPCKQTGDYQNCAPWLISA